MRFDKSWTKFLSEKFGKDEEGDDPDIDQDTDDVDFDIDSDEADEDSSEEMLDDLDGDEEVETENLVDEEDDLDIDPFSDDEESDDSEDTFDNDSEDEESSGSSSGFDSWLEDAGTTGEVSDFENFDELPDNDELESDSSSDEFGADARSVFSSREKVGPSKIAEAVIAGRTLEYDVLDLWIADARKNGYRTKHTGGSPQTKDRIYSAFYKDGSNVGKFSEEDSSGWMSFVVSEGRDLLRFFTEQGDGTGGTPPAKPAAPKKSAAPAAKKYQYDSEDKVPQNAKWLQIAPSKIGATDVDSAADKVKGAGLPVMFAASAYGKAKIAYPGTTPAQKVNDVLVKLGLGEDEASGIAGGRTETMDDKQLPDGSREGMKASLGAGKDDPGQDQSDQDDQDLSDQVDDDPNYEPQRQDSPEEDPDEDTLHVSVKGTDEVVSSLKKASIKVKSFGNHGDNDYIRVDAQDAAALHQWMSEHGWDDDEAEKAISGAKQHSALAPIKNAMKEVLGDEAPDVKNIEDFKTWLQSSEEGSEDEGSEDEDSEDNQDEFSADLEMASTMDQSDRRSKIKELKKKYASDGDALTAISEFEANQEEEGSDDEISDDEWDQDMETLGMSDGEEFKERLGDLKQKYAKDSYRLTGLEDIEQERAEDEPEDNQDEISDDEWDQDMETLGMSDGEEFKERLGDLKQKYAKDSYRLTGLEDIEQERAEDDKKKASKKRPKETVKKTTIPEVEDKEPRFEKFVDSIELPSDFPDVTKDDPEHLSNWVDSNLAKASTPKELYTIAGTLAKALKESGLSDFYNDLYRRKHEWARAHIDSKDRPQMPLSDKEKDKIERVQHIQDTRRNLMSRAEEKNRKLRGKTKHPLFFSPRLGGPDHN